VVSNVANLYMGLINAKTVGDDGEAVDTGPLLSMGIPTMINMIEDKPDH
jgi:hypothetical protein